MNDCAKKVAITPGAWQHALRPRASTTSGDARGVERRERTRAEGAMG